MQGWEPINYQSTKSNLWSHTRQSVLRVLFALILATESASLLINQSSPENPVSTLVLAFLFCQSEKKSWVNISYGYFVPEYFACHLSVK